MVYVVHSLIYREWAEMKVRGDPLGKLHELRPLQHHPQLRLPHKDNLQQLRSIRIDIGQHAQLFQRRQIEILRFVDHQHRVAALLIFRNQEFLELPEEPHILQRGRRAG